MADRPLYAKDFNVAACGRYIAESKRRIRFRFGWANAAALAAGRVGAECRGEETDVTLIWSINSAKLLILHDAAEVYYSDRQAQVVDFSWKTKDGAHQLRIYANAVVPKIGKKPGFRQYQIWVDGRSFFDFPRVHSLGLEKGQFDGLSPEHKKISPMLRDPGRGSIRLAKENKGVARAPTGSTPHGWGVGPSSRMPQVVTRRETNDSTHNEAYLRKAIEGISLEDNTPSEKEEKRESDKPRITKEASQLLIDFLSDFDNHGNILPPVTPTSGGDEWGWGSPPAGSDPPQPPPQAPAQALPQVSPPPLPAEAVPVGPLDQFAAAPSNPFGAAPAQPPAQAPAVDPWVQPVQAPSDQPPTAPSQAPHAPAVDPWGQPVQPPSDQPRAADLFAQPTPASAPRLSAATNPFDPIAAAADPFAAFDQAPAAPAALDDKPSPAAAAPTSQPPAAPAAANPFAAFSQPPVPSAGSGGAMVPAAHQGGNWQAPPQYTMAGGYPPQQQPPPPTQQQGYGQPPQPATGHPPQMGYGQQPPPVPQQGYGASQYGQQPPMQQNQ